LRRTTGGRSIEGSTDNAWGYSPLDQVKRENVGRFQLAWSWAMNEGAQEATPLVHDGIMYLPNAARCGNRAQCTPGRSLSAKIKLRPQRTPERKNMSLPSVTPMPLARFDKPFDHPDWIFEPKLDGFRAVAYVEDGR
jgi:ATP-dependent DNA ligase